MKNNMLFFSDEEQSVVSKPPFFWWRSSEEFDENGHIKADENLSSGDLSKIQTPRLKVVREMERLGFVGGEGVDELRHRLLSYRAGDFWLPVGGIKKEEMDVPQVITILLTGLTASGKSALVNLMYSVLGNSGLIPFAQTSGGHSNYTTVYLEEHNVLRSGRSGFCVYDTRGVDPTRVEEGLHEVSAWMSNGVRHNQPCYRSGDDKSKVLDATTSTRYVTRKVNCAMVVADLSQIHMAFASGDVNSLEALRDLFHLPAIKNSNECPILILTHGDTLNGEDRMDARVRICEYLGIGETSGGAYDIPCLTEQGILADPVTAYALMEVVYRALLQCDRAHVPKKMFKHHLLFLFNFIMCSIASFFAFLARFFSRFDHNKLKM